MSNPLLGTGRSTGSNQNDSSFVANTASSSHETDPTGSSMPEINSGQRLDIGPASENRAG